jgi:hypothetical protein
MKPENVTVWLPARLPWLFDTDPEAMPRNAPNHKERACSELETDGLDRLRNPSK